MEDKVKKYIEKHNNGVSEGYAIIKDGVHIADPEYDETGRYPVPEFYYKNCIVKTKMSYEQKHALHMFLLSLNLISKECEASDDFNNMIASKGWLGKSADEMILEVLEALE